MKKKFDTQKFCKVLAIGWSLVIILLIIIILIKNTPLTSSLIFSLVTNGAFIGFLAFTNRALEKSKNKGKEISLPKKKVTTEKK